MTVDEGGDATIRAYEAGAQRYLDSHRGVGADVVAWLDAFVALLPPAALVLEIGSGPGTDAAMLEARGLRVIRSDATRAFADRLRAAGHDVLDLDIRSGPLPAPLDGVFASAVLLHLTGDEFATALGHIGAALTTRGVLAFTLKEGDGEIWTDAKLGLPRRFTFWRTDTLRSAVESAGFEVVSVRRSSGDTDDWLQVLARSRTSSL